MKEALLFFAGGMSILIWAFIIALINYIHAKSKENNK
jgi:hypothetical protein